MQTLAKQSSSPWTHSEAYMDLYTCNPYASASRVAGVRAHTTGPCLNLFFLFIYEFTNLFSVWACDVCTNMFPGIPVWGPEDNFWKSVFSFDRRGSWHETHVSRQLSHLISPLNIRNLHTCHLHRIVPGLQSFYSDALGALSRAGQEWS